MENEELRASSDADGRIIDWTKKQLLGVPDQVGVCKLCLSGNQANIKGLSSIAGKSFSFGPTGDMSVGSVPLGFKSARVTSSPSGVGEIFVTPEAIIYNSAAETRKVKLPNAPITSAIITSNETIYYADSKKHIGRITKKVNSDPDLDLEGGIVGKITALAVDSQERYLAAGDDQRRITLFDLVNGGKQIATKWCHHSSTIGTLAWSPDGSMLVSGGLDNHLFVWSPDSVIKPVGQVCSTTIVCFYSFLFNLVF